MKRKSISSRATRQTFSKASTESTVPLQKLRMSLNSSPSSSSNNSLSGQLHIFLGPPAPPDHFSREQLQQRLTALIEGARESWTYAIFWEYSSPNGCNPPILGWGDGYYKGEDKDEGNDSKSLNFSSSPEQEYRKRVIRELFRLVFGTDPVDVDVTDTEWFFLVSTTQSFINGIGLPGQAFLTKNPISVSSYQLATSTCERARQAQALGLETMVCIPLVHGVVELGSTKLISQTSDIIHKVDVLFNFRCIPEVGLPLWPNCGEPDDDKSVFSSSSASSSSIASTAASAFRPFGNIECLDTCRNRRSLGLFFFL